MIQEDKDLLLKDICARLPYKVKVHCKWNLFQGVRCRENGELVSINIYAGSIHFKRTSGRITEIPFNRIDGTVLPYLRFLSNMTNDEEEELRLLKNQLVNCDENNEIKFYNIIDEIHKLYLSHHIDFMGLIEKGLALEAPENMYKFN